MTGNDPKHDRYFHSLDSVVVLFSKHINYTS